MKINKIIIIFFLVLSFVILITNKTIETLDFNKVLKNYKLNNEKYDFNIRKLHDSENVSNLRDITNMEETCNSHSNDNCLGDSNCGLYYKNGQSDGMCVLDNSFSMNDIKPYFIYPNDNPHISFPHYDMNTGIYTKDGFLYKTYSNDESIFDNIKFTNFDFNSPSIDSIELTPNKNISKIRIPGNKVNIKYGVDNNIDYNNNIDNIVPILTSIADGKINIDNYELSTDSNNKLIVGVSGIPLKYENTHMYDLHFFKKFGKTVRISTPSSTNPKTVRHSTLSDTKQSSFL